MKTVYLYSDGACKGNPGVGGWGCILQYGDNVKELKGAEAQTTNNRMELMGAITGFEALKEPCIVVFTTDSKYVISGISDWIVKWKNNNWKTSAKKDVLNKDLWQRLEKAIAFHSVQYKHVRGHTGHVQNERCDVLANEAINSLVNKV